MSATNNSNGNGGGGGGGNGESSSSATSGSLLRQTLMAVDECFVYKIPPMATSGGHRAEQWDLAKPIQTCGFQVERRDNDLYLLFTTENHTKLFALAHIAANDDDNNNNSNKNNMPKKTVSQSVQSVVDSSRYFVTQIAAGNKNKTATIGFGFRDRDVAIDLLGTLQGFQKSIEREQLAKQQFANTATSLPTLAPDEKIHISIGGGSSKVKKDSKKKSSSTTGGGGGGGFMLKKPPKFEEQQQESKTTTTAQIAVELNIENLKIQEDQKKNNTPKHDDGEEDSEAAVGGGEITENNDDFDDDFGDFQEAS